jgi:hypothetical protein
MANGALWSKEHVSSTGRVQPSYGLLQRHTLRRATLPLMRPMLLECGMLCSRFHDISSEPITFQDGDGPKDHWDPML